MSKIYSKIFGVPENERKNQELYHLHLKPQREKRDNMPHFQPQAPNMVHQADLLFLPNDNGYKYALVVVDIGTRYVDAVPLKSKTNNDVKNAFIKLYSKQGTKLKMPRRLEVDAGSEFKGDVKRYFDAKNIVMRVAQPNRHRQQAIVERKNQTIGHILHQRMNAEELLTGETSRVWVKYLPKVIKAINEEVKNWKQPKLSDDPVGSGTSLHIIPIGTKVRVALDAPLDVAHEQKLYGRFRKSDIRWDQKIRTVKEVLIKPGFPPLYLLDGNIGLRKTDAIPRTKQQLQLVNPNEIAPDGKSIIAGNPKKFVVDKLLDRVKIKNVIYFIVAWKGFKEKTKEPRSALMKMVPDLVRNYENKN